ncbi:alanine racemase [Candidatus Woesebacteria bacterium RBG_19FT_COMBO_42_9]|uniref:Alanine racemase n=1 Tax=Candidatus Woesebacteria bacterium RBG_16_42_24 TaxID=1802485 RepID=A0A1F7XJH8_9BACT|nr:MAG: alanine racemase [Candidatus Woesebacteria bacterium RBG_16_42_24]OGM17022.1 MAG: alanine racemase [Candidatus Woesebacteria bacterium RBG_19FT_COMBO_42_9]OGM67848.1 MAG: alanine racemase [Candidatus Woesebacteria bacterium RIFCSPLOWO2_01_FULL_43_11]
MHSKNNSLPFKTWIEISRSSLLHNLSEIKGIVGAKTKIGCVIKANAYGHGIREVVEILKDTTDWFCVDNIEEALIVRELSNKPIVILGYTPLSRMKEAIEKNISMVVYNRESINKIVNLNLPIKAKLHIKIETGLNRQGVGKEALLTLSKHILKNEKRMFLEGVSTHFANIEDTLDASFANLQLKNLNKAIAALKRNGIHPPLIHSAASAGAILYPKTHFKMVRIGIALYGLWPSRETKIALATRKKKLILKPVLSWKSIVAQVKEIEAGESVGYGRSWFAHRKTKIAVVPVGYSDGYDRGLSNNSRVLIKGKFTPLVGRVAMNMIVVDVTNIKNVHVEDEVLLMGPSGKESISAEELAERSGTINYEMIARINERIPRVLVR